MDLLLDRYKANNCVMVLEGTYNDDFLTELKKDKWHLCNINDFHDNLSFWNTNNKPFIDLLFSSPIKGLKQYLLERHEPHIVVHGDFKQEIDQVMIKYDEFGYDVLHLKFYTIKEKQTNKIKFYPTNITNRVQLKIK